MPQEIEGENQKGNGQGAKKKGPKLVILIAVAAVVVGLGVAGFAFKDKVAGGGGAPAANGQAPSTAAPSEPTQMGVMLPLGSMTVNLAPGSARNVLKVSIELDMQNIAAKEAAEKRLAQIKNAIIMSLTNRLDVEMNGEPELVKRDLLRRFEMILGENAVRDIYFTELLMK